MNFKNATLEITTKIGCKINCKYCPQDKLIKKYFEEYKDKKEFEYMSFKTFKECIDKVPIEVCIDFSGMCEPWLNPECTKMVKYASQKGHKIRIFSTLEGMTEDDIEELKNIKIDSFVLHTPDVNNNSNITIDENYKAVLKKLMDSNIEMSKAISSHSEIVPEIYSMITSDWAYQETELIDRAGNVERTDVEHRCHAKPIMCELCGWDLNHNVLLPDGKVLLCCMDYGMKHVLGNLTKNTYEEIFEGEVYKQIKEQMMKGEVQGVICGKCSNAQTFESLSNKYVSTFNKLNEVYNSSRGEIIKLNEAKDFYLQQIENTSRENKNLSDEIVSLKTLYENLKGWTKELEEAKIYFGNQINKLIEEKQNLENQCDSINHEKDKMKDSIEKLQMVIGEKDEEIANLEEKQNVIMQEKNKWKYRYNNLIKDTKIKKLAEKKNLLV